MSDYIIRVEYQVERANEEGTKFFIYERATFQVGDNKDRYTTMHGPVDAEVLDDAVRLLKDHRKKYIENIMNQWRGGIDRANIIREVYLRGDR